MQVKGYHQWNIGSKGTVVWNQTGFCFQNKPIHGLLGHIKEFYFYSKIKKILWWANMIRFAFTDYGCLDWMCEDPLGRHCNNSYYNALDLDKGSEEGTLAYIWFINYRMKQRVVPWITKRRCQIGSWAWVKRSVIGLSICELSGCGH